MKNFFVNEIILSTSGSTICGPKAHALYRKTQGVFKVCKLSSDEKYHVFEVDGTHRAGQSTLSNAINYMTEDRVLVYRKE